MKIPFLSRIMITQCHTIQGDAGKTASFLSQFHCWPALSREIKGLPLPSLLSPMMPPFIRQKVNKATLPLNNGTQFKERCFHFWKVEKERRWTLMQLSIYTSYLLIISILPFLLSLMHLCNSSPIHMDWIFATAHAQTHHIHYLFCLLSLALLPLVEIVPSISLLGPPPLDSSDSKFPYRTFPGDNLEWAEMIMWLLYWTPSTGLYCLIHRRVQSLQDLASNGLVSLMPNSA